MLRRELTEKLLGWIGGFGREFESVVNLSLNKLDYDRNLQFSLALEL
jgi:hypothetical protein